MKKLTKKIFRVIGMTLAFTFVLNSAPVTDALMQPEQVQGAEVARSFALETAKNLAVAWDTKLESLDLSIDAKKVSIQSAVRSLKEKKRNMSTIRWSPLLSFKWPTKAKEDEDLDFQFKPTKLTYELRVLQHKRSDQMLAVYEKVSTTYTDVVDAQEQLAMVNERLENIEANISKLEKRVKLGMSPEADLETAEKNEKALDSKRTSLESKIITKKRKLGAMMGIEIDDTYKFQDPFQTMNLKRDALDSLKNFTVEHDETCYEAKKEYWVNLISLRVNYSLCNQHYRKYIGNISGFVQQALNGERVNKKAFKKAYDKFLKDLDARWKGKKRILFIKFPREWIKGQIDGIRYVDNDPYVLYQNALDYVAALQDYNNTVDDTKDAVEDSFDSYIEYRKAYLTAKDNRQQVANDLVTTEVQYLMGNLEKSEYDGAVSEYEAAEDAVESATATYTNSLYSFDRLTCGGLSQYFTGNAGDGGVKEVYATGATYSISQVVENEEFILYVDFPDDYEATVTHFSLICDRVKIGEKTPVGEGLRHLALSTSDVAQVIVRLYNGDEVVGDCEIDPTVTFGPLQLIVDFEDNNKSWVEIGDYEVEPLVSTDMTRITLKPEETQQLAYYNVLSNETGKYLYSDEKVELEKPFDYVAVSSDDLSQLKLRFYDEEKEPVYDAIFDTSKQKLKVEEVFYTIWNEALQKKVAEEEAALSEAEKDARAAAAQEAAKTAKDAVKKNDTIREELMSAAMEHLLATKKDQLIDWVLEDSFNQNGQPLIKAFTQTRMDVAQDLGDAAYVFCSHGGQGGLLSGMVYYYENTWQWKTMSEVPTLYIAMVYYESLYDHEYMGNTFNRFLYNDLQRAYYRELNGLVASQTQGAIPIIKQAYKEGMKADAEQAVRLAFAYYLKTHDNVVTLSDSALQEIRKSALENLGDSAHMDEILRTVEKRVYEYYWNKMNEYTMGRKTGSWTGTESSGAWFWKKVYSVYNAVAVNERFQYIAFSDAVLSNEKPTCPKIDLDDYK